jgi:hypothetical protein
MNDQIYNLHLEGRILTEGRARNAAVFKYDNPYQPRELIRQWTNDVSMHWGGIETTFQYQGPGWLLNHAQLRFAVSKATVGAELIHAARLKLLDTEYHTSGDNFNYKARFEDAANEFLTLVEHIIETLRTRAADLPKIPDSMPAWKDDTKGFGLNGRIQNLTYARHLADLARGLLWVQDKFEHPRCNEWIKLSATVERNLASALIDRAKVFEGFRNKRMSDAASVTPSESRQLLKR